MKYYKKRLRKNKVKSRIQELALKLSLIICIILAIKFSVDGVVWAAENSQKTKEVNIEISRNERQDDVLVEAGTRETEQLEGLEALEKDAPITPHSIEDKIRRAFPEDADMAIKVAKCESSLEPDRIGDTHLAKPSIGLYQINQIWHDFDTETLLNVDENIKIAKQIYERSGKNWNRWTCGRLIASGLR